MAFAPVETDPDLAPEIPEPQSDPSALTHTLLQDEPRLGSAETPGARRSPLSGTQGYVNRQGLLLLGVPGRKQFDQAGGYCGELSVQMHMLKHGVWLPQSVVRAATGGESLLGVNYDRGLNALGINYVNFRGRGAQAFFAFAKEQMLKDRGVIEVMYFSGGSNSGYDHIVPMVGVKYTRPTGYDANDVFYVHTNYAAQAVQRQAGGYSCSRGNKQSLSRAGCVPNDTRYGTALAGPRHLGVGPPLELHRLARWDEPGGRPGSSQSQNATLTARNLTSGARYAIYNTSKPPAKGARPGGTPFKTFTASGTTYSTQVQLFSNRPAWFVCVQQGAAPAAAPKPAPKPAPVAAAPKA